MKKLVLASLISTLAFNSYIYAGAMGETDCEPTAFATIEGSYTINKIDGITLAGVGTSVTNAKSQNPYGGRIAAGMIHMLDEEFALTGELGWGYYGSTTSSLPVISFAFPVNANTKSTLSGFDALVGGAYIQTYFSVYAKVGGIIQNMQQNNTAYTLSSNDLAPGFYTFNRKTNQSSVLPAAKIGLGYNVDTNWSITASYLFAYGASTGTTITYTPGVIDAYNVSENTQNPMTNTLMLGIQFMA